MKKWKASDMRFVQVWNCNRYEPEKRNYTNYALIYRTPAYKSYGDEYGGSDNGSTESICLSINVEEGTVFLDSDTKAKEIFENERELELFIQIAQNKFDREVDMGTRGSSFIYGYGGTMASLMEYDNPNIEYIPLVFPNDEKFQNPRYREKVEWSLIQKGAIFISPKGGEKYLAVIQRKSKPRDLKAFARYTKKKETVTNKIDKPVTDERENFVTVTLPKWLAKSNGLEETISNAVFERETEKAVLIKYAGKTHWLPKSKIKIA